MTEDEEDVHLQKTLDDMAMSDGQMMLKKLAKYYSERTKFNPIPYGMKVRLMAEMKPASISDYFAKGYPSETVPIQYINLPIQQFFGMWFGYDTERDTIHIWDDSSKRNVTRLKGEVSSELGRLRLLFLISRLAQFFSGKTRQMEIPRGMTEWSYTDRETDILYNIRLYPFFGVFIGYEPAVDVLVYWRPEEDVLE